MAFRGQHEDSVRCTLQLRRRRCLFWWCTVLWSVVPHGPCCYSHSHPGKERRCASHPVCPNAAARSACHHAEGARESMEPTETEQEQEGTHDARVPSLRLPCTPPLSSSCSAPSCWDDPPLGPPPPPPPKEVRYCTHEALYASDHMQASVEDHTLGVGPLGGGGAGVSMISGGGWKSRRRGMKKRYKASPPRYRTPGPQKVCTLRCVACVPRARVSSRSLICAQPG